MTMTFKQEASTSYRINQEPDEIITVSTTREDLGSILETFERFLRGCGFQINGTLTIEYNDEDQVDNNDLEEEALEDYRCIFPTNKRP